MRRVVLWDFDGTLAYRDGMWSGCLADALEDVLPAHRPLLARAYRAASFDAVVKFALTGYEKPHPEAFAAGRRAAGEPDELWMVGDNAVADIEGATAAGIPAILVRRDGAPGLDAVVSRLGAPAR